MGNKGKGKRKRGKRYISNDPYENDTTIHMDRQIAILRSFDCLTTHPCRSNPIQIRAAWNEINRQQVTQ